MKASSRTMSQEVGPQLVPEDKGHPRFGDDLATIPAQASSGSLAWTTGERTGEVPTRYVNRPTDSPNRNARARQRLPVASIEVNDAGLPSCGDPSTSCSARLPDRVSDAHARSMAVDLNQQWFRGLAELRYTASPKRLRALLSGHTVMDTRDALLVYEPRRIVPWYAVPPSDLHLRLTEHDPSPVPELSTPVLPPRHNDWHTVAGGHCTWTVTVRSPSSQPTQTSTAGSLCTGNRSNGWRRTSP
jgi:hypothetical protein